MGKLYDHAQQIQTHIERNKLDVFKTRGEIALRCGFLISIIRPDDPDDAEKIRQLEEAARDMFGIRLV